MRKRITDWIPLTKPNYSSPEEEEVLASLRLGLLQGDGPYSKKIHRFFEDTYGVQKALFTSSCTDALELSALLLDLNPGDEVIVPSYTFVSSAHAFRLRGAKIVFADSCQDHPNLSIEEVKKLLSPRTKAVVPVHYAGFACEMEELMALAQQHHFVVIADAAQAIDATYKGKPLISWGHMSTLSFHQTKNISCGEGGLLAINDSRFIHRSEILREKGTNRCAFFRGEVDKYNCVDIGSSYLGSDLLASLLWAQLGKRQEILFKRKKIWNTYHSSFADLDNVIQRPTILPETEHNGHCYFLLCRDIEEQTQLSQFLKDRKIGATFHYMALHDSPYYKPLHDGRELPWSHRYSDTLLRLPLFPTMTQQEVDHVIHSVRAYFEKS